MTLTYPGRDRLASADEIEASLLTLREQEILLSQPGRVAGYLRSHPDLTQALPLIGRSLRTHFPFPTPISLELYIDPEVEDRYLTLSVWPTQRDTRLFERIHAASEAYWPFLENTADWLLITFKDRASKRAVYAF